MGTIKHRQLQLVTREGRIDPTDWESTSAHLIDDEADIEVVSSATYVVAAYNANERSINRADYKCNGTADQVQINAALAALPAAGGKVYLTEGQFNLAASITPVSNALLEGAGEGATILKRIDSSGAMHLFDLNVAGLSNFTVKDMKLDGNADNNPESESGCLMATTLSTVTNLTLERVWGINPRDGGIVIGEVNGFRCINCRFTGFSYSGSREPIVIGGSDIHVCHNIFDTVVGDNAISICNSSAPLLNENVEIIGNLIRDVSVGWAILLFNTATQYVKGVVISGNVAINCRGGIEVYGATGAACYDVNIIGNTLEGRASAEAAHFGVRIDETVLPPIIVKGNVISKFGSGIHVRCPDVLIEGNWIDLSDYNGIGLNSGCHRTQILNNVVRNSNVEGGATQGGIDVNASDNVIVRGNKSYDNRTPKLAKYGINIMSSTCDNCVVEDNDVTDGGLTANFNNSGTNTIIRNNIGWTTAKTGVATNVTLDASGVGVIPHTCDTLPAYANVICQSDNLNVRVSSIDATNINILVKDLDNAVVTADTHDFYWEAKL